MPFLNTSFSIVPPGTILNHESHGAERQDRTLVPDHVECYSDRGPVPWTLMCQGETNLCLVFELLFFSFSGCFDTYRSV